MADINIILDEELDYEGEEPPKSNEDEISLEDEGEFGDESFQDKTIPDKKTEEESKRLSRKRRYSPPKWFKGEINEYNEIDPGRDLSEPKRFKFIPNSLPENFFPDECDPDNIPLNIIDDHPELTRNEVENLFETLNVNMQDEDVPLNTILIWGATDMTHYAIEKIFAEYHPHIALKLDNQSYVVQFKTSRIAAKMFIGMSKKLKRVRQPKNFEEGEIEDSDEEKEGQIIADDNGEQVELVQKLKNETELSEEVQFDITKMKIPKGKWRIITKHVPIGKTLLAKYAHITEIKKAMNNFDNIAYRQERVEKQKSRNRLKPGINVFDSAGNELPWDFEHDTRIFNDPSLNVAEDKVEEAKEQIIKVGDQEIRSRGRGTRKVVTLNFSSDEDDNESEQEEDDDNANEVSKPEPSQKPSDFFRTSVLGKK